VSSTSVALTIDGAIARLKLARPAAGNAIDRSFVTELRNARSRSQRGLTFASWCCPRRERTSASAAILTIS
jgi:hypothetical protein